MLKFKSTFYTSGFVFYLPSGFVEMVLRRLVDMKMNHLPKYYTIDVTFHVETSLLNGNALEADWFNPGDGRRNGRVTVCLYYATYRFSVKT